MVLILVKKVLKNISDFVDLMNNKVKVIGMKNIYFVNLMGVENLRLCIFVLIKYKD